MGRGKSSDGGSRGADLEALDDVQGVEGEGLGGRLQLRESFRLEGGDLDVILKVIEKVLDNAPLLRDLVWVGQPACRRDMAGSSRNAKKGKTKRRG